MGIMKNTKKKTPIPPLEKHRDHQVEIQPSSAHNFAKYYCVDCGVFVAWLSRQEAARARELNLLEN